MSDVSEQPDPPALIAVALRDRSQDVRVARIRVWVAAGGNPDDLRPAVLAALADPDADTRRRALRLIPDLPGDTTAYRDSVLAALADPAWTVREAAAPTAGRLPDPDGAIFRMLLGMSLADPHVRETAAAAIGPRIEPERDYGAAIRHRFERQRVRAALALGHVAPERAAGAVGLLAAAVAESHAKVRWAALRGLTRLPAASVLRLLPLVVRKCFEADVAVATEARVLCKRLGDILPAALRPLELGSWAGNDGSLCAVLSVYPPTAPLRRAWDAVAGGDAGAILRRATPAERRAFAVRLARFCERALAEEPDPV
jgi:hypothetical protein